MIYLYMSYRKRIGTKTLLPTDFQEALRNSLKAGEAFAKLSPSHQREYMEWIEEAKTEITRQNRIQKTLQMIISSA